MAEAVIVEAAHTPVGRRRGALMRAREQAKNVTRTAWLHAGLPHRARCTTNDCSCGSSHRALYLMAGLNAGPAHATATVIERI